MTSDIYSIENIIEVQRRRHKFKTNEYQASGSIPIIDQSTDFIAGFTDEVDRAYDGELPVIIFGDHTCCLKFVDFRFAVGADGTQLLRPVKGIDARYLYYALHAVELKQFGYQRHFKLLKDCEVRVPPLETQRRVASILGAYDDLIEVNRRRIAVLEEMARGLFEEWFVRFRFPGHEAVPIHDTPEGSLPEGWTWGALGDLLRLPYGKALKADARRPGDVAVIGSSGVVGSHVEALVAGPGIVVGRKGNVGSVIWSATDFWPIDTTYYVDTRLPLLYVYQLLQRVPFENSHAAVPGLNRDYALARAVMIAPDALVQKYGAFAEPLMDQVKTLEHSNRNLAASRDLLLPRLISGQLSVVETERELEEAA
ncbi:restriction endonuclease subunit S [Sphingomonas sp. KC8]|uniref:restriction endonuclease subunit S n=1 Tax=Sphingomonas sp. KC8 TaxID=1030157 RepID=UPI0002489FC0|nr:restriction endonuclease subunit S [Sphingomonas sp. KC8]ARS26095.1 restriction modification system subunit S [Sphingomonas sp. KC8]